MGLISDLEFTAQFTSRQPYGNRGAVSQETALFALQRPPRRANGIKRGCPMAERNPKEQVRVHLTVCGGVQGVFFRVSAVEEAGRLGLRGWVRNLPEGSVELVAEGRKQKIEQMIRWCHQGPPGARVQDVQVLWEKYQGSFEYFSIKR